MSVWDWSETETILMIQIYVKLRGSTLRQKSYVGPQYPDATGNIFCRRYYSAQIFNVSSSLFNNAEKYEIYCP